MCLAPSPDFASILEGVRQLHHAAGRHAVTANIDDDQRDPFVAEAPREAFFAQVANECLSSAR